MEPLILPRISNQKPLVSVISITYNHEPFIRACLEGFMMQQTSFPVEFIIHDDASTDHTADIIREYYQKRPDLFHVIIEKENLYSQHKPIMQPLYDMAQGKYVALCEGDDYWIDPLKLQKQFNYMEQHPQCNVCSHRVKVYEEFSSSKMEDRKIKEGDYYAGDILKNNLYFYMCSLFYKRSFFLAEKPSFFRRNACAEIGIVLYMVKDSYCHQFSDIMGTYRLQNRNSVSKKDRSTRENYRDLMQRCLLFWRDVDTFFDHKYTIPISYKIRFCEDGIGCSSSNFFKRFYYYISHKKSFKKEMTKYYTRLVFIPNFYVYNKLRFAYNGLKRAISR